MITMIDVGIERPIGGAGLAATQTLGFTTAFLSVSNIVFAFGKRHATEVVLFGTSQR